MREQQQQNGEQGAGAPPALETVYFVVKKVARGQSLYAVAESTAQVPPGWHRVAGSATLQKGNALSRKKALEARGATRRGA